MKPAVLLVVIGLAAFGLPLALEGQSLEAPRTVARVDLSRYVGDWFEISRFPNRFQTACLSDVQASYAIRPDGRLDVVNRCRTAEGQIKEAQGVARIVDTSTSAKLKVRFAPAALSFLPFVWGDYWIIGLAEDYSWAVVGSPDRKYLWVLARTRSLDASQSAAALGAARAAGFDVNQLVTTRQTDGLAPAGTEADPLSWLPVQDDGNRRGRVVLGRRHQDPSAVK
jgi:apolipoprotein D and lipocalin family protein